METKNLPQLRISEEVMLEDNSQWTNRFKIRSESSGDIYIVSQNKAKRHWACSCRGWIIHRKCKHLAALGLPSHEKAYEVKIIQD